MKAEAETRLPAIQVLRHHQQGQVRVLVEELHLSPYVPPTFPMSRLNVAISLRDLRSYNPAA
eukprot:7436933-Karenia_brevis.AAC.1